MDWTLGIADINAEQLDVAGKEFQSLGAKVIPFTLDVSDKDAYKKVADDFLIKAGGIDMLFNNAGVWRRRKFRGIFP